MRIDQLCAGTGLQVDWRAFLLGPIFRDIGWNDSPFKIYPIKGRYMWRDLERICDDYELEFRRPTNFPRNGLRAARIACHFRESEWVSRFVKSVYLANFAQDREIAEPEVLSEILTDLKLDPKEILEQAQSPGSKQLLRTQTEKARELGIFGAPTTMVDQEMFWGNDRLEQAVQWALKREKS